MNDTDALFRLGDAAQDAGDYHAARSAFEQGAALGDMTCLERLAFLHDTGLGAAPDKAFAMRAYQRVWRRTRSTAAANNIAILYREQGRAAAAFRWFARAAEHGDGDAMVEVAKRRLKGHGVRRSTDQARRILMRALASRNITEAGREEAAALLAAAPPGT
ncbi:hypothetical protein [Phenylobacterium sp.]|jgi:TPR repeat protein|uniref:hypothetical protein n=1 Tax=Phenylobacterium sp. TaxID=1871053 RepID=UPI0035B36D2A